MYQGLLHTHSGLRYLVLLGLLIVIVTSLMGWLNRKPFTPTDNKLSLFLFIATHTQLLVGLILYFVSPFVKFDGTTMSDKITRYWSVEHIFGMLVAVVLITLARSTSKRMTDDNAKHKRMFIFNFVALVVIVAIILISDRKLIG
ncbi:cytochrome B [Chryseolinea sp. T2]|uniref:cytochrome B n=1 Tax=Chryseolinea sp. T2 TaxID=3129255 RepID=UPI00307897E5